MASKHDKNIKITVTDNGKLKQTTKDIDNLNKSQQRHNKSAQTLDRNLKGNAAMSSNASKNFSKQAQGMNSVLVPAYAEVAARVFALTAAFNALSNVANYNVLIKGQSEYAKMTGKNMGTIARSVQVASKHMLDFKEASTSVALATTSGLGTGQIIKMTKAAVDSSAALGRSMTDTMDRLTRGIVKAEPEILDEIGVIIRLDTVYKQYAQSVSKSTAELTEGEKATARYNAIMGQLENKFGGIASKIDPNYFQALASAVLDLTNKFGTFLIDGLNPILKWFSESKGVLGLFMALIAKSLVGKIFPVFSSFGKKISSMPKQMGKNIDKLETKINRLSTSMVKGSKVTAEVIKKQAEQILKPSQRGAAFDKNPLGSTGATLRQARASVKDGIVTYGKLAKMPVKSLDKLEKAHEKLNNAVKKGLPLQLKAEAGVHKYQKLVLSTKKAITGFAASQIRSWSFVTKAIDNRGVIGGVALSVRMLGKAWDNAALSATWYGRMAARANVGIQGTVGAASALGSVLGKAGHVGMALYATYQIGKMVVDVFADLDTPFMRAADAASELSESLKTSLQSIDEMDSSLNMEGFASNALESTRNAEFAANLGEELYNATSKAMKKLKADISTRSFWDDFADFFKSIVGKGLQDSLRQNIADSLRAMEKLNQNTAAVDALIDKLYKGPATINEVVGQKIENVGITAMPEFVEDVKTRKATRADKLQFIKDSKDQVSILQLIDSIQKQSADSAKTLATNIKNLGTQFDKVAKAAKTYKETLIEATPVDEMATAQKEIKKIWESDTLSGADKIFQAQEKGFLKQNTLAVKSLEAAQKKQTELKKKWLENSANDGKDFADSNTFKTTQKIITDWAKTVYNETTDYLQVMDEDWLTMQKNALNATTDRITAEMRLNVLQKFAKSSSIKEQAKQAQLIAEAKWEEAKAADTLLQKDTTVSDERKLQSATKLLQLKVAANLAGAREVAIATEINKRKGTTLTLTEEYNARAKDLEKTLRGVSSIGKNYAKELFDKERAAAAEKAYYKILNASNENFKVQQQILAIESEITEIINARVNGASNKDRAKLTRMALLNLTKEGKTIKSRHKAIDAEMEKIIIEDAHWEKGDAVLDYKMRVAKIEREVTDERFKKEKQILAYRELMLEKARLETGIVRAELEKTYSYIRAGLTATNNEFNATVATTISDALMNLQYGDDSGFELPTTDDVRYFLAKTMSDQVGNFVGGIAEKGLVAMETSFLELLGFGPDTINQMLPADPIREMANSLKAIEDLESNIDSNITAAGKDWKDTRNMSSKISDSSSQTALNTKGILSGSIHLDWEEEKKRIGNMEVVPGEYTVKSDNALRALTKEFLERNYPKTKDDPNKEYNKEYTFDAWSVSDTNETNKLVKMYVQGVMEETLANIKKSVGASEDATSFKTGPDFKKFVMSHNRLEAEGGITYPKNFDKYASTFEKAFGLVTKSAETAAQTQQDVKTLVKEMGSIKWGDFNAATKALKEGFPTRDDKPSAFKMSIDKFDGDALKQASLDLHGAFEGGAFKVNVQNFEAIGSSIDKSLSEFFNNNLIDPGVDVGSKGRLEEAFLQGSNYKILGQVAAVGEAKSMEYYQKMLESNRPKESTLGLETDAFNALAPMVASLQHFIDASLVSMLNHIDELSNELVESALASVEWTVSTEVGDPLRGAAADIADFMLFVDTDFSDVVYELTRTLGAANSFFGLDEDKKEELSWYDKIFGASDETAKILKKEQGPNSFSTYDKEANTLLKAINNSLSGKGDVFANWKPGMTKQDKFNANWEASKMQDTKTWLEKRFSANKHLGAAAKGTPFGGDPYEGKKVVVHERATGFNRKVSVVEASNSAKYNKGLNPLSTEYHPGSTDTKYKTDILSKKKRYEELMKNGGYRGTYKDQHGFFEKLSRGFKDWWNKGKTATEGSQKWFGKNGLWADDAAKMAHTDKAFKAGETSLKTLAPWKAFLDMDVLKTGPTPAVRQAFERGFHWLGKLGTGLMVLETATISGSTPLNQRLDNPQAKIDSYKMQQGNAFTSEAEYNMLQHLIDVQQAILDKMPEKLMADGANQALVWADDGAGNSLGINLHNPEVLTDTSLNIAADAAATAKQGVRQLISSGEVNTRQLASSFATGIAGKAMDKAVDSIWDWGMTFFAKGGIAPGGFRAFANGGTVSQPTLGLVGEGKYNEAVVPLPDGKSIPVIGSTGGDNNVTVNVTVDSNGNAKSETQSGMDGDQAKQLGYMISQAVQSELVEQQRPGGLLSQY